MLKLPADIFTEQPDIDPDTLANLGPLTRLAGTWQAKKGVDTAPKAKGPERRVFIERVDFVPIDPQSNGPQTLYGLRYHIHITTEQELITFHDQIGYWLWEPKTGLLLQTLAIPRGQIALASGKGQPGDTTITVSATRGKTDYGICSTDFLEGAFRTESYQLTITFNADGTFSYAEHTALMLPGRGQPFLHHDENTLTKIAEPQPNPLMQRLASAKIAEAEAKKAEA